MRHRSAVTRVGALAFAGVLLLAATDAVAADHRHRGGGGWSRGGGGVHHNRAHFHSFLFFGAGYGYGYPYYSGYPAYPADYPPPTYVSRDDCYQPPVPRSPGVADLYTCAGQFVGTIAVP